MMIENVDYFKELDCLKINLLTYKRAKINKPPK